MESFARRVALAACRRWSRVVVAAIALTLACSDGTGPDGKGVTPARMAIVSGDGQGGEVGTELPVALVVRVEDAAGHVIAGQLVNFRVVSGGGSVYAGSAITGADGIARERWTLGTTAAESQKVEARAVDQHTGNAIVFATFTATAHAGPAATLVASAGDVQSGEVGAALAIPLAVRVVDRYGNPIAGASVTWTPAPQNGGVDATTSTTDASGTAATRWTLGTVAGTMRLEARSGTLAPVSFAATARAGAPARVESVRGDAQHAEVGTAVAVAPAVRVVDAHGNAIAGATVTFAVLQGGGSIASGTATTGIDGVASGGAWTLGTLAGAQRLRASVGALTVDWSATADPGAPASLVIEAGDAATATVGSTLAVAPTLRVVDRFGNAISGVVVTFGIESGGGTLAGAATRTSDAQGRVVAGSWTLGTVPGANTVRVTAGALSTIVRATAVAGAASSLAKLSGDGQVGVAGEVTPARPSVRVTDAFGNVLAGVQVTFTVASGGGLVVGDASVATGADGVASVGGWTLGATVGANTLTASTSGLASVSFTATALAGAAASLAIVRGDGQQAVAGRAVAIAPAVIVRDRHDNAVSDATVVFEAVSGGGSVQGSPVITGTDGVAAVQAWTLGAAAGPNMLRATVGLLPPVTFAATGRAGDAANVSILGGDAQVGDLGRPLPAPLVVRVTDAGGNAVADVVVSWRVAAGDGTLSQLAASDAQGLARATWTLGTRMDSALVEASLGTSRATFSATPRLPADAQVRASAGAAQRDTIEATLRDTLVAEVVMADGRPIRGAAVSWSAPTGGSLTFAQVETDATGRVRAVVRLGTLAAELSAVARAGEASAEFATLVLPGAPASLAIVTPFGDVSPGVAPHDIGVAAAGAEAPMAAAVRVRDRRDNLVAGILPSWSVTSGSGSVAAVGPSDGLGVARAGVRAGSAGVTVAAARVGTLAAVSFQVATASYTATAISTSSQTCGIFGGALYCWGTLPYDPIGAGFEKTFQTVDRPRLIDASRTYVALSVAPSHACALDTGGRAYCWGWGLEGELGIGGGTSVRLASTSEIRVTRVPAPVVGGRAWSRIAAGRDKTCAIEQGTSQLYCWGDGTFGRDSIAQWCNPLGISEPSISYRPCMTTPTRVLDGIPVVDVALGRTARDRICAVAADGRVYCSVTPGAVPVPSGAAFTRIAVDTFACALTAGGEAWCWGGLYGYLFQGATPTRLASSERLASADVSGESACGDTSDGRVACWGRNSELQLGVATTGQCQPSGATASYACSMTPVDVGPYHGASAGGCALGADGVAVCWGGGRARRGDLATAPDPSTPRPVQAPQ